jgi:hypothetical protein
VEKEKNRPHWEVGAAFQSSHLDGRPIIQIKIEQTAFCAGSSSGMKKFLLTGAVSHLRFYQRGESQKNNVYLKL